jgi:leader peptidase (prepilin peptidase)/N-methyltransferase
MTYEIAWVTLSGLLILLIFFLGAAVGSFINVVADRLSEGKSIVHGGSVCDHCKRRLKPWELIPVISFLVLRGRCHTCRKKLSERHPIVELLMGIIFLLYFVTRISNFSLISFEPLTWQTLLMIIEHISLLILIGSLVAVSIIDWKVGIIPDEINYLLVVVYGVKELVTLLDWYFRTPGPITPLLADNLATLIQVGLVDALFAGGFFYLLLIITNGKGMGGGDVKLAFVMGLLLTFRQTLLAVYLSFVLGGIYAVTLIIIRRKKLGQTIPFGPFLALGGILAILYGSEIIDWYRKFFGPGG